MDPTAVEAWRELLQKKGSLQLPIKGNSMEPLLPAGASVTIEPLHKPVNIFDIVAFVQNQHLVCHYVHHINHLKNSDGETIFITRGLNTNKEDLPVPESALLGKVVGIRLSLGQRLKIGLGKFFQNS